MSTFSYANIAANGSTPASGASSASNSTPVSGSPLNAANSPVSSQPQVQTSESDVSPDHPDKTSEPSVKDVPKQKPKKLAPAPVPTTSVWGSTSTNSSGSAAVDEYKWPTPDQHLTVQKPAAKGQKFIKTNKWVPINAKVVMPNARNSSQAQNQGSQAKKNNKKNKNNRNKKTPANGTKTQHKRGDSADSKKSDKPEKDQLQDAEDLASQVQDLDIESPSTEQPKDDVSESTSQSPKQANGSAPSHTSIQNNGHYSNNRPYSKVNYRSANRYSLPNGSFSPNFIPFAAPQPQPYHHPSLPNNYYAHFPQAYNLHPVQAQYQGYPQFAAPVSIPPPISPKQDPINAFIQQVDYYFSLENLIKDIYLRKKFDKDSGYIGFSEILNFKRVQIILNQIKNLNLTAEYEQVIVDALNQCTNVEIDNSNPENEFDLSKINVRVKNNFQQWVLE